MFADLGMGHFPPQLPTTYRTSLFCTKDRQISGVNANTAGAGSGTCGDMEVWPRRGEAVTFSIEK